MIAADDESGASVVTSDTALAEAEPALAQLAVASTQGTLPAGPALHRQDPITLRAGAQLAFSKALRHRGRLLASRRDGRERRGRRGTRSVVYPFGYHEARRE